MTESIHVIYIYTGINKKCAGNQAARTVAIAAGSEALGGGLLLLMAIMDTIMVCLAIQKWKAYNLSTNQTSMKSSDKIATCTVTSVAYKPVLHTLTINAGFEITHGTTK